YRDVDVVLRAVPELMVAIEEDEQLLEELLDRSYFGTNFVKYSSVESLNMITSKASEKKSLINKVLYYAANPESINYSLAEADRYLDIVCQAAKRDRTVATQ